MKHILIAIILALIFILGIAALAFATPSPVGIQGGYAYGAALNPKPKPNGDIIQDPTGGADHYYNPTLASPSWGEVYPTTYEGTEHIFKKEVPLPRKKQDDQIKE